MGCADIQLFAHLGRSESQRAESQRAQVCDAVGYGYVDPQLTRSVALDSWNEALPAALILNGHSQKNALPHIIALQLAKEWLTILIYRPYYRSISGHGRSDIIDTILGTAVTVSYTLFLG
jgi:hypothetical protein